jgi:hypothetical protein
VRQTRKKQRALGFTQTFEEHHPVMLVSETPHGGLRSSNTCVQCGNSVGNIHPNPPNPALQATWRIKPRQSPELERWASWFSCGHSHSQHHS